MKAIVLGLSISLCLTLGEAQGKNKAIRVLHGEHLDERASTRILYWNIEADKAQGELVIEYRRNGWMKVHDDAAYFDRMTLGKPWGLGENHWTTLDTNVPLRIGNRHVAAGYYYLGLYRSADGGTWSLIFLDPVKVRQGRPDPLEINEAPHEFIVPMKLEGSSQVSELLAITLSHQKENPPNVTLKVAWGRLQLSALLQCQLED